MTRWPPSCSPGACSTSSQPADERSSTNDPAPAYARRRPPDHHPGAAARRREAPNLAAVVERLTFLQLDPTAVVAPSADLIAWSRLGSGYSPAQLQVALERDRTLFEHRFQPTEIEARLAMVRPMVDLGLFLADMAAWSSGHTRRLEWMRANEEFRRRVLDLLLASGPLASRYPRLQRGGVAVDAAGRTTATSLRYSRS